jgi:hypothetical protein
MENVSKPKIKLSSKKILLAVLKGLTVALVLIAVILAAIWFLA